LIRALIASFEQHLHSNADAEKWPFVVRCIDGGTSQTCLVQSLHTAAEIADARQDNRVGGGDYIGVVGQHRVGPNPLQRLLGGPQIADAIVDYSNTWIRH
jgi:hypothetical protein